ncbi:hypothetical protein [Streptomyces inhibens]|uniref:nSTAND3 domain-containing NTPase n=1 Tax=Streptomyces inhibens TaxID=2293571 RepID=UPI001EE74D84|nr:hypothetical protein [Streptomyces inhibens]UKY49837.1 hypothetical protein KI385_14105 [Streptomyces inhibens]
MPPLPRPGAVAAPGSPTFALHTLGWRAFQDLCAAVLRHVWGQSVHAFADSNDGGRDGAFYGSWQQPAASTGIQDLPAGPFVLQCKHTKKSDSTLAPSDLDEEFAKVKSLVRHGICHSYVLLTNARVSGTSEATICARLRRAGVIHPLVLDGQWVCDTIATHQQLRMFAPRVYGLGDLSQVLDERAYVQAQSLLGGYLREELSTFVVTTAYQRALRAVQEHGFVLLLGEPAAGKSVIASTLAMTALDAWGCLTVNAHDAAALVQHWNPHEPNQFFWIDDAFGSVRHEQQLTDSWSRHMRKVMAAVHGGAKVVLTSRDYIYRDARPYLKEYAYPLLHEQQVVVDVAQLPMAERRQILYNHVKRGDQPREIRAAMKPHLDAAAAAEPFHPEVARRLGKQAFTRHLELTADGITRFMARPTTFLRDVYTELGPDEKAALALTYQAGEQLPAPLSLDGPQSEVITRLGSTPAGVSRALHALNGTFLRLSHPPGSGTAKAWSFRHPTLHEGFAELMADDPNLLGVFIAGSNWRTLLNRIDCGTQGQHGTLLRVPASLYPTVAQRLHDIEPETRGQWEDRSLWHAFFATRCSDAFLKVYTETDPQFLSRLMDERSFLYTSLDATHEAKVLARLHQAGLLGPDERGRILQRVTEVAVEAPDAGWLRLPEWQVLLTDTDRDHLLKEVRAALIPNLESTLDDWYDNQDPSVDPSDYYQTLKTELRTFREAFDADHRAATALDHALEQIEKMIEIAYEGYDHVPSNFASDGHATPRLSSCNRSIFDDIDT